MSRLHAISRPDHATADVIFVHGLAGHPFRTWQHDEHSREDSWPFWLAQQRPDLAVRCLEYDAGRSQWVGHAMPLVDRSRDILTTLELDGIGCRPLIFVCHSLGGLVAKQLLRQANDTMKSEWLAIARRTHAILFLATPHAGAELATWLNHLGKIYNATPAVDDLTKNAPILRDLNGWYRANAHRLSVSTHVFYETKKIRGILIVDENSADPGISGLVPIPLDANHITISKPGSLDDVVCRYLLRLVKDAVDETDSSPEDQLLSDIETSLPKAAPLDERDLFIKPGAGSSNDAVPNSSNEIPSDSLTISTRPSEERAVTKPELLARNPDFVGRESDRTMVKTAL